LRTTNKWHGLSVYIWQFCSLNMVAKAFVLVSKRNKFITKTKAMAWWDFGSFVYQIAHAIY